MGDCRRHAVNGEAVDKLVKTSAHDRRSPPDVKLIRGRVAVGSGHAPRGGGEVWLVRFDPHDQSVLVRKGENRGKTIVEHNVVRELVRLGTWTGRSKSFVLLQG